jgi:2-dehydropantoate 2-reductase
MWEDLERRRSTEIDELQGAVVRLAGQLGRGAPVNARVLALVRAAEAAGAGSPRLAPEAVSPIAAAALQGTSAWRGPQP